MVEAYQQKRLSEITYRGTTYKPASVNRELEVMRRIYNLAMREEMVMKNPCWKVTRLSGKKCQGPGALERRVGKAPQRASPACRGCGDSRPIILG